MKLNFQSSSKSIRPAIAAVLLLSGLAGGGALYWRSQSTAAPNSLLSTTEPSERPQPQPAPTAPSLTVSPPAEPPRQMVEVIRVSQPVINVYADPSSQAEVVTQAIYGEPAEVLSERGAWQEVAFPDQSHYSGWVQIAELRASTVDQAELPHRQIVTAPMAAVYASPSRSAEVLKQLRLGSLVDKQGDGLNAPEQWTQVRLADGRSGFVLSDRLAIHGTDVAQPVRANAIAQTAKQLLGQPYLWGGMTTDGVDCSGFTHTVFKTHGIRLHRDADQQFFNDGFAVDRRDLQTGDLVFFETYAPGPSHVGIFLGNDQFIHAGSSGVVIASLSDAYFSPRFLGARRVESLVQDG